MSKARLEGDFDFLIDDCDFGFFDSLWGFFGDGFFTALTSASSL